MKGTMHLDTELIQRVIHDELSEEQRSRVLGHLESCEACQTLVAADKAEDEDVFGLIAAVKPPPAAISPATVMAQGRPRARPRWGRWAAAALLTLVGVGTAYAAPGSPIPEWLGGAFGGGPGAAPTPGVEALPGEGPGSGIMVDLSGDWTIDFPDPPSDGELRVTTEEGSSISIRSSDVGASFDWDVERVTVRPGDATAADFSINVPPAAASVEIVVRERTVWRRAAGQSVTTSMEETEDGIYHLHLDEVRQ